MTIRDLVAAAEQLSAAEEWDEALKVWSRVLQIHEHPEFRLRLAAVAQKTGKWKRVEAAGYSALAADSSKVVGYLQLAHYYDENGSPEAAAYWYREAASRDGAAFQWNLAGGCYRRAGFDELARECLSKALELEPENDEALYEMALTYVLRPSEFAIAIPLVQASIEADSTVESSHNLLGLLLARVGQADQAITSFEKALQIDPLSHWAWFHFGEGLLLLDRPRAAEQKFRHALELKPRFAPATAGLARLRLVDGDRVAAEGLLLDAIEADPSCHEANFEYGRLLTGSDRGADNAATYLWRAYDNGPLLAGTARRREILTLLEGVATPPHASVRP